MTLRVFTAGSLRPAFDPLAAEWRNNSSISLALAYANARDLARRIEAGEARLRCARLRALGPTL